MKTSRTGTTEIWPSHRPNPSSNGRRCIALFWLNDDYTLSEFVVYVLEQFFSMGREKAAESDVRRSIRRARAYVEYTRKILPETKASRVNQSARDSGHPLLCEVEPSNDDEDYGMLSKELENTSNETFALRRHEFITVEHLLLALLDDAAAIKVSVADR